MGALESSIIGQTATLSILGGCVLHSADGRPVSIPSKKVRALLAYLVLEGASPISRERLAGILWSEKGDTLARQNLRQALVKLRAALDKAGVEGYSIERDMVFVNPTTISVDVSVLEAQFDRREVFADQVNDTRHPDRILSGLESLDGLYDTWLHHLRHSWATRLTDRLQGLLDDADPEISKRAADTLIALDPTHEPAYRALFRYFADQGNSQAAEKRYRQLWNDLDAFGSEPEPATQDLIVEIKAGTYVSALRERVEDPPTAEPAAPDPALAVPRDAEKLDLPQIFVHEFREAEPGGRLSARGTGLRLELISNLVRFRDWTVLDAEAGLVNPGYQMRPPQRAGLTHSYAIYGTIHETDAGSILVITLKDLTSGTYLWSDRFDTNIESWIRAQRRISIQLAGSLNTHLSAKLAAFHIEARPITNDAYLQWLDCYHKFWSWDPQTRYELRQSLNSLIADYPSFAPAYTGLVTVLNTQHVIYPGIRTDPADLSYAATLSNRAVQLDPMDARNIGNLGWSSAMNGQFDVAAANFRRAIELNPNDPNTLIGNANGVMMSEDPEAGYRLAKEAIATLPTLTPVQWAYITSIFCLSGHFEECIEAARYAGESMVIAKGFLAVALAQSNQREAARDAGQAFLTAAREKWQGAEPCTQENIRTWFINHCPVRHERGRDILRQGLADAQIA